MITTPKKLPNQELSKAETERRFTAALGRALSTPHKPHKPLKAKKKKGRATARPKVGEYSFLKILQGDDEPCSRSPISNVFVLLVVSGCLSA